MVDAQLIFEDLKSKASTRQAKSLDILNEVLKAQYDARHHNFSIAEIARLSVDRGGPSASTIRNKTGLIFRQLIEAWAAQAGTTMKLPANTIANGKRVPKDNELLTLIEDPVVRAVFGQIIAERNRFRNELNTLKANSNLMIDLRPKHKPNRTMHSGTVQVLPALTLNEMEIEALKGAVSERLFERRDWSVSQAGQVKDENGREIFKHGFVSAIKKILQST